MSEKTISGVKIKHRKDTAANWTSINPVLLSGELAIVETTSGEIRFKVGNGTSTFTQLPYTDEVIRNDLSAKADSDHTHDNEYYRISEIDTKFSQYYTESEIDTKLGTKSDSGHSHNADVISLTNPLSYDSLSVQGVLVEIDEDIQNVKSDLTTHTGDTTVHITANERTNWDSAKTHAESAHAPSNAEKNQNAFSNIIVGGTTISADTATDSLTLVGSNVTITPDATNDKVTIAVATGSTSKSGILQLTDSTSSTSTTTAATPNSVKSAYDLANSANTAAANAQSTAEDKADALHTHEDATTSKSGFMSTDMVSKLSGIESGANKTTVDSALSSSSTNPVQNKVVNTAISNLNTLVGTTSVASQISSANETTLASAQEYADNAATTVKNDLLNGAGTAYDTLKELGDLIDDNVDAIDALEAVAAGKADAVHTHTITADSTDDDIVVLSGTSGSNKVTYSAYHANSGVNAGSYGDSSNQTPAYGETFKVPYVTVNATGHVTGISTHTVKIPVSDNTDTQVTQTVTNSNENYPLLLAPSGQTADTTTTSYFDSGVTLNPSTNTINANISGSSASCTGNAATATKATEDGSGNIITSTYATKTELNGKSDTGHTHEISNVNGLQSALGGKADTEHTHEITDVTNLQTTLNGKYVKPSTGIPKTDLASEVQTSLGKADTAVQSLDGYATESYVNTAVSGLVASAPETLNTLNELAAALGDDPNFATTVSNQIGNKANASDLTSHTSNTTVHITSNERTKWNNTSTLVGDTAVSTQITNALASYYTKAQIDAYEFITVEDVDEICGTTIQLSNEVEL